MSANKSSVQFGKVVSAKKKSVEFGKVVTGKKKMEFGKYSPSDNGFDKNKGKF